MKLPNAPLFYLNKKGAFRGGKGQKKKMRNEKASPGKSCIAIDTWTFA